MEMVYYTVAGLVLYLASDWILDQIERFRGERFPQRSLIFFIIILSLSTGTFQVIQSFLPASTSAPTPVSTPASMPAPVPPLP